MEVRSTNPSKYGSDDIDCKCFELLFIYCIYFFAWNYRMTISGGEKMNRCCSFKSKKRNMEKRVPDYNHDLIICCQTLMPVNNWHIHLN